MTQQEFSGDFTKMHVLLRFRVTEVVGQDALTTFVGHAHQSDHTRRQIRRYRGKIDDVVDVVTTDGFLSGKTKNPPSSHGGAWGDSNPNKASTE